MDTPEIEDIEAGDHLISAYWELDLIRELGEHGPAAIKPRDIVDWSSIVGFPLRREEITILLSMDAAFREAWHAEVSDQRKRADAEEKSKIKKK